MDKPKGVKPEMPGRDRLSKIPVRVSQDATGDAETGSGCEEGGLVALQVLGDDMLPEFANGEVVVIEPGGRLGDGSFVVAKPAGEWMLRQLNDTGNGWQLVALDPAIPAVALANLDSIFGVVIQKSKPGRRRSAKRYD